MYDGLGRNSGGKYQNGGVSSVGVVRIQMGAWIVTVKIIANYLHPNPNF